MKCLFPLIKRNVKLFFKDKAMFFTALITPGILLVLYATFLGNVYHDSFTSNLPEGVKLSDSLLDGLVGGQLMSSIMAVSCVTVAFCSNFLMVQDKVKGTIKDLRIAPVKSSVLSLSYYIATIISTLIICYVALGLCLGYIGLVGWYLSFSDIIYLIIDVFLGVLFGTALTSLVYYFLSSEGQLSAVGSIVSAGYGFICGAYMPIYSFGEGLQHVVSFLPGTYLTSLFRGHSVNGVLIEMEKAGITGDGLDNIRKSLDCDISFFGNEVSMIIKYLIIIITVVVLVSVFILLNYLKNKKHKI